MSSYFLPCCCCCCCSHINSHDQVRGHRTGSSHSGAEEYPREKCKTNTNKPKVVHAYCLNPGPHAPKNSVLPSPATRLTGYKCQTDAFPSTAVRSNKPKVVYSYAYCLNAGPHAPKNSVLPSPGTRLTGYKCQTDAFPSTAVRFCPPQKRVL